MRKGVFLTVLLGAALMLAFEAPAADDVTYSGQIRQLFMDKCISCHGQDSPEYGEFEKNKKKYSALSKGPRMDSYPHLIFFVGWPDNGAIMRRLDDGKNTRDGKQGNMYQYLGATEEERQKNLSMFRSWVGNWNLRKWSDVTKEEMNGLKVKY